MPHSHNIDYYLGRLQDESLAEALADFEYPLDGRAIDFLCDEIEDFAEDDLGLDFDDY